MSKAVLISLHPEWCEKIINGQKTIEVRKTRPRMDTPFKCYIYKCGNGKVIGGFLCDQIINIIHSAGIRRSWNTPEISRLLGLRSARTACG